MSSLKSNCVKTLFKCLIELNDSKLRYTVIIDSFNNNSISFSRVLHQIKESVDQNISLKTHSFQLFDKHINDYVIIKSDNQVIENLSRIRVSVNNENNHKINNKRPSNKLHKEMATKPKSDVINGTISKTRNNKMNSNSNPLPMSPVVEEKIRRDFHLINCVFSFIDSFNNDSTNGWKLVSKEMTTFGYKLTENNCKQLFNNCISRYVEVLESSKSFENACLKYQSFAKLNNIDLKSFMNSKTYGKVLKLKEKFKLKPNFGISSALSSVLPQKQVLNPENIANKVSEAKIKVIHSKDKSLPHNSHNLKESQTSQKSQEMVKTNSSQVKEVKNKSKFNSFIAKRDNNIVISVKNDPKMKKTDRRVEYKPKNSTNTKPVQQKNDLISNTSKKSNSEVMRSDSTHEEIGKNTEDIKVINKTVFESELAQKVLELSSYFITKDLFINEPTIAWQMVSLKLNYEDFSGNRCRNHFNDLISRFAEVLQTTNDITKAREKFYLFDIFSKIDLTLFLDPILSKLIIELKRKFGTNNNNNNNNNNENKETPNMQSFAHLKVGYKAYETPSKVNYKCEKPVENPIKQNTTSTKTNRNQELRNRRKTTNNNNNTNYNGDKSLLELIKTGYIDNSLIREQVLNASDICEQINCFRNEVLLRKEDYEKRHKLKDRLEAMLKRHDYDCILHFFGSTANSVGFRDSDIDLFIELKRLRNCEKKLSYDEAIDYLMNFWRIFKSSLNYFIPKPIESLRCPLIKIDFKYMSEKFRNNPILSEELSNFGISCDINISNALGLHNSRLLRLFCEIEPRFQDLAIILRFWAKMNNFINTKSMSSYAFTQLVVFFCQNTSPPLLPTVDYLRHLTSKSVVIDGWECSFCDYNESIPKSDNKQSVIQLLAQFFKFYANFSFTTQVICVKTGLSLHKYEFNSLIKTSLNNKNRKWDELNFKMTSICCIEDPFNLEHNLTANMSFSAFDKFTEYIKHIALKSDSIFNTNKGNKDWGISKIITQFDPTNGYSPVVDSSGFPNLSLVLKSGQTSTQEIIKTMVNEFFDMTLILLENVYEIDYQLTGKWDVILNQISPFAQFRLKFNEFSLQVIDNKNRELIKSQLKSELKSLGDFDREKAITEKLIENLRLKKFGNFSIACDFVLFINARITCPVIEYEIMDLKTSSKTVTKFLANVFAFTPRIIQKNYYKNSL